MFAMHFPMRSNAPQLRQPVLVVFLLIRFHQVLVLFVMNLAQLVLVQLQEHV